MNNEFGIDLSWVNNHEEEEKKYDKFYKKNIEYIFFFYCYISSNNEIFKIKREKVFVKNKRVPKEEIIYKIKKNINDDNNNYHFLNILKYNDITTIEDIYHDDYDFNENMKQFNIGSISDMEFEDTIELFEDLNMLFFIYKERKNKTRKNKTRKNNKDTKT